MISHPFMVAQEAVEKQNWGSSVSRCIPLSVLLCCFHVFRQNKKPWVGMRAEHVPPLGTPGSPHLALQSFSSSL